MKEAKLKQKPKKDLAWFLNLFFVWDKSKYRLVSKRLRWPVVAIFTFYVGYSALWIRPRIEAKRANCKSLC